MLQKFIIFYCTSAPAVHSQPYHFMAYHSVSLLLDVVCIVFSYIKLICYTRSQQFDPWRSHPAHWLAES